MEEKLAIKIAGKLESFLHIPSFLCEYLQNELQQEHYEEVIEYIIERKEERDIEMQDKVLKKLKEKGKEIERLQREKEELQVNGLRQETLFKLEIERLHSIIKEVKEEIIKDREKNYSNLEKKAFYCNKTDKLLEILDKEN